MITVTRCPELHTVIEWLEGKRPRGGNGVAVILDALATSHECAVAGNNSSPWSIPIRVIPLTLPPTDGRTVCCR